MSLVSLVRTTYFGDHVEVYREYYDPEGRFFSEVEIRERVPARRPGPAPHPDSLLPPIKESPEDQAGPELPDANVVTEVATPGTSRSMDATPEPVLEIELAFEGSDLKDNDSDPEVFVILHEPNYKK